MHLNPNNLLLQMDKLYVGIQNCFYDKVKKKLNLELIYFLQISDLVYNVHFLRFISGATPANLLMTTHLPRIPDFYAYLVFVHLLHDPLHDLARVFERSQDFLRIAQPICVDLEHGMEILDIRQVLF